MDRHPTHHGAPHDAPTQHPHDDGCERCPLAVDRRRFLRGLALAALGTLAASAAPAALAAGVRTTRAVSAGGMERAYPIPATDGVSVDEANEVILVRWRGRVYAFSSRCTHRGARLEWREDEGRVFCPKHKARFAPDGAHASGRRTRALDRYDLRREGDRVVVLLAALRRADEAPAAWARASLSLG